MLYFFFFGAGLLKGDMFPNISNIDSTVGGKFEQGLSPSNCLVFFGWFFGKTCAGIACENLRAKLLEIGLNNASGAPPLRRTRRRRRPVDGPGPKPATQEATGAKS